MEPPFVVVAALLLIRGFTSGDLLGCKLTLGTPVVSTLMLDAPLPPLIEDDVLPPFGTLLLCFVFCEFGK